MPWYDVTLFVRVRTKAEDEDTAIREAIEEATAAAADADVQFLAFDKEFAEAIEIPDGEDD